MLQTRGLTLRSFLRASKQTQDLETAKLMDRMVHKALFENFWSECDTSLTRLFATQGHLLQYVFGQELRIRDARKLLKAGPVVGWFRPKNPIHEDIRFICMLHRDEIVMLADAAALDSGMAGVSRYERQHECFMPLKDGFVEFVTNYDFTFRLPAPEVI
jgi:hypothetical protein